MINGVFGAENSAELIRDKKEILSQNLLRSDFGMAREYEKRIAHIKDISAIIAKEIFAIVQNNDIITAVYSNDAAWNIYMKYKSAVYDFSALLDEGNKSESEFLNATFSKNDTFYLCKSIAHHFSNAYLLRDIAALLSPAAQNEQNGDKKVAFLKSNQANEAFECFAKGIFGASVLYQDDFSSVLEAVYYNRAQYAIIPIENSMDGRLMSFNRLMEKYDLKIILSCDIPMSDGENMTKYALLGKNIRYIKNVSGNVIFECNVNLDELKDLATLFDAAEYFGVKVLKTVPLPFSHSGRENLFSIRFCLDNADYTGFFCYMFLEQRQFTPLGLYTELQAKAKI